MAGCSSGIDTIEVKAPNGRPSLLFQNLLKKFNGDKDKAYYTYLQSQVPGFGNERTDNTTDSNGELFVDTVLQVLNEDLTVYLSRDLGNTPKPEKDSVMAKILEDAQLILDPEVDENGNQADSYGITGTPGGAATSFIGRVSSLISEFTLRKTELKDRAGNPYPNLTEAIVNREAESLFRGKSPDERVSVEGIEYNKAEFIEFKRAIYKQGQVKGDLIHALLQFQIAALNNDNVTMDALKNKISQLENLSATEQGSYNWVIQKENFQAIMKNAGIIVDPKVPSDNRDKVYSEISVANADMEVAGKIDTLVEKPSGRLKIIDYKTGNRFNNNLNSRIMNYGSQEFNLYDNALGRAKLQTMLYSVIIKANNPAALFEPPMVMHIPDEFRARSQRNAHQVEVRDYLKMIEQFYRSEKPEAYAAMVAKSPNLFNPSDYGATRNTSFTQDMINDKTGMRDDEMLTKYEVQLEQLITSVSLRTREEDDYKDWTAAERKQRDELMRKIAQARTTLGLPQGSTKDYEVRKFTQWLGTINDTHNPYIQSYAQVVNQQRLKVYEEYENVENEFNSKLTKVMEEKFGKQSGLERAFKPIDKQKVFANLINEEIEEDPTDGQRRVKRGLITEQDSGWVALTQSEKELVQYMRKTMKDVFEHVMTKGPNAVVSSRNGKNRTKLDVYNDSVGAGFKWSDSFIPKVGITSSEVRWNATKNGFEGAKNYVKHQLASRLSMFYEQHVEGENQNQYGIPVKYLGSGSSIHNPDIHTSNLEVAFKSYMQHMVNKKHYDSVYALGDSVKSFLESQQDKQGNYINKGAANFLGYHMHRNLIGRIGTDEEAFWRKGFRIGVSPDGRDINFSPVKFMRTMNSGVAAAALWLKIPSAMKNAGQAVWAVGKESMVNSLASTEWGGVSIDKQDLSNKNHAKAYSLWMDYQKASMLGKGKDHPVHVFMKSFRMYPDTTEMNRTKDYVVDGGKVFDVGHLSVLYSYPESMTTAVTAMDAMMTMKIKSGPYAGQSMWEVYANSVVKDPVTGEGKFELPADFTRGKLRMGDDTLQELKGLNPLEVQKLHRIIQRVKGGYRQEERSMIESTAIGEMFMLFRRWLPASIVQGFKSKQYDYSMGYLAKTDQEDVYEWQARMTEGRWRTLAGVVGQYTGMTDKRGYQWADLSDLQRKNIIDAAVTLSTFSVVSAITMAAFADADDEDSMKKWASEMNMRIIEQWNFISMIQSATQAPAAVTRALELLDGTSQLGMATAHMATGGEEEDIYTRRGDLRGANKVLKNIPVAASFYDVEKFIENSDYFESEE